MSLRLSETRAAMAPATRPILRHLALARIAAAGGASRAALVRDLNPLLAHRLSPAEWRAAAETALAGLVIGGLAAENRGRFMATPAGEAEAARVLALEASPQPTSPHPTSPQPTWPQPQPAWEVVRDCFLPARALGAKLALTPASIRALSAPEGLRALILQAAFGLALKPGQSASKLRAELAGIALERAFGNRVKNKIGANTGLNAKAGRLLAGQLSRRPQDFGSDGRLIAALAAEQAGAAQTDYETLKLALLRGWLTRELDGGPPHAGASPAKAAAMPLAPPDRSPASPAARPRGLPANDVSPLQGLPELFGARPDMAQFVTEVGRATRARAEGWPGNLKAFISHVWQELQALRPDWRLSEIEFKAMLSQAHRAGHVALANADLKDKKSIADFEASAIRYKNAVWHFVRVED